MIDVDGSITRRGRIAEALVWAGAALTTLGVHAGLVAWMLRAAPISVADSSPPVAVMVEIAATPEAVQNEKNEIAPDQKKADESVPEQERKQEDAPEEPPVEETTKPDETKPVPDAKIEDKPITLEKADVQLPPERPKPKKTPREKPQPRKKPKPQRQHASVASRAALQAQAQARRSDRMAAAQTASGASSMSPASWQSLLMAHLERRKRYPAEARERGERGTAYVRFAIDGGGNVLSATLVRSSGFAALDREVVALVHRASPVPPPPPGASRTITAPVRFSAD